MLSFLALMCVGTFCLGAENILKKKLLNEGEHEQVLLGVTWLAAGLVLAPFVFFFGIPELQEGFWLAVCVTVLLNLVGQNLFVRAMKLSDVSLISPLRLIIPPLVIVTSFLFLGEYISFIGMLGVFTTVGGLSFVLAAGERGFSVANIMRHFNDPGVRFGLLGSFVFAIAFPFDKLAVVTSSGLFASSLIAVLIGGLVLITAPLWQKDFTFALRVRSTRQFSMLFAISVLLGCGTLLTNMALAFAPAAYASSAKRFQVVWTNLLAGAFLKEQHTGERLVGVLLMLLGLSLMVLFP